MFVGRFEHQLDDKGRVVLPAAFRKPLASGAYVAQGLDGCLNVWEASDYEREAREMVDRVKRGELDRNVLRVTAANAAAVSPDAQGRIAIPGHLRDYGHLRDDRTTVVVIGAIDHIELWSAAAWQQIDSAGGALLLGPGA